MKERPILFSGPMVRAILEGRKKQTRRVVTRGNSTADGRGATADFWPKLNFASAWVDNGFASQGWSYLHVPNAHRDYDGAAHRVRSRIEPGDRLWVRETWAEFPAPGDTIYRASFDSHIDRRVAESLTWRPSIHLPRTRSRITLAVTSVRVERLQEITGEDARDEGVTVPRCGCEVCSRTSVMCPADASAHAMEFASLWQSINGKRPGCSWDANPWVWVVGFERVESEVNQHG